MRKLIFRPVTADDRAALLSFWWESYNSSFPYISKRHPQEGFPAFYDLMTENGNEFHVADNGSIVGMCAYHEGHIQHVYVSASHRRRGIGSEMVDYLIRKYEEGLYYLYVYQKNLGAIRLYKNLGFRIVGEHVSKFEEEPGYRMERTERSN